MLFNMINLAYADAAPVIANSSKFDFKSLVPIVLIFVVMYYFLFRPQQKKFKQQSDMIASLRRGDKVIIAGGIIGSIHKIVSNEEIIVEISDSVRIRVLKSSVNQVLAKTEPISTSTQTVFDSNDEETLNNETIVDALESELSKPLEKVKKVVKNSKNALIKRTDIGNEQLKDNSHSPNSKSRKPKE